MQNATNALIAGLVGVAALLPACDGREDDSHLVPAITSEDERPRYDPARSTGVVEGAVRLNGAVPAPRYLMIRGCDLMEAVWRGKDAPDPAWAVNADGTLPHVFVWAESGPHVGLGGYEPQHEVSVTTELSYFRPHVFGVLVGQEFRIANGDMDRRYLRVAPRRNAVKVQEQNQGVFGTFSFRRQEMRIAIRDDKHPWMSAWAFAMEHPFFATSDEKGHFEVTGLPAGDYVFRAWHETFGETSFEATVGEGETVTQEVRLDPE